MEKLPKAVRMAAEKYIVKQYLREGSYELTEALLGKSDKEITFCFMWQLTEEGHDFWGSVHWGINEVYVRNVMHKLL